MLSQYSLCTLPKLCFFTFFCRFFCLLGKKRVTLERRFGV
jgi:hypothetical protein